MSFKNWIPACAGMTIWVSSRLTTLAPLANRRAFLGGCPLRLDARQQRSCRFIAIILRDELAGEGFLQDGLAQGCG